MRYSEFLERSSFNKHELIAHAHGTLVEDPPAEEFGRLPSPPFLMFDRISELTRTGSTGRIVAEQDIQLDAWYFQCHFKGDPVQPGCLGLDAVWQLIGFYCFANGGMGSGRALGCEAVEFLGQIRPHDKLVRYEVNIRRLSILKGKGAAIAVGDGKVFVDGELIYNIKGARVGSFTDIHYPDYPKESANSHGGVLIR
ncbi:MAG: bifunctional 3-hydroxydecanoyl-ACP dehydratase/trans-2-decenoyl-ACP isomerase [Proteobacteria bacterium]|nr:bifunctional 3-hydroxydecanoyl-ACP dehydratase/trans-2-decenoyl-ACP isomerase [Pseudomonadota bacterium]